MSEQDPLATSVRQRLLNRAKLNGEDYNLLLARYVVIRFLSRLANSKHADTFLLKGATMFLVWQGSIHRPTRDLDLLGLEALTAKAIEAIVREICETPCEPDAVVFDVESISSSAIREDNPRGGIRTTLTARLGSARQQPQIDIGYGDAVDGVEIDLPILLDGQRQVRMRGYPVETVVAEKFEALVTLGMQNSRMKDFFDLASIADTMSIDARAMRAAIEATFERRRTPLPNSLPVALTEVFWTDETVKSRWLSFARKNRIGAPHDTLEAVCKRIITFLAQFSISENNRLRE